MRVKKIKAIKFFIRDMCDIVIAMRNSGLAGYFRIKLNEGLIGTLGIISSLIGLQNLL